MTFADIVGKTIKSVDEKSAVNVVLVVFTDGSGVMIDTETVGFGLYRPCLLPLEGFWEMI